MPGQLSLKNISKVFHPHLTAPVQALHNVSLDVEEGEFICIIGANGSGKSTLFRAIAGAYKDTQGTITLNGRNITSRSEYQRSKLFAMVDQQPGMRMAPGLSIEQNLALWSMVGRRRLWQIAVRRREREMFREILTPLGLGLENRLESKVRELSGGQAQALTVAAATRLRHPQVLLLDEHCAALDPRMSDLVMKMTAALCKESKITTLMITHDFEHAALYGDRLILMREGVLAEEVGGEEKKLLNARAVFDLFMRHQKPAYFEKDRTLLVEATAHEDTLGN